MATLTTTEARTALSRTLERFRERGIAAEPLVFGDHRRPEGVVVPYEVYVQLLDEIDQLRLEAAEAVMQRIEDVISAPSNAVKVERRRRR
jgi:antitoxin StbD